MSFKQSDPTNDPLSSWVGHIFQLTIHFGSEFERHPKKGPRFNTAEKKAPLVFKLRVFVQVLNQRSLRKVDDERNRFENQVDYFF